MGLIVTAKHALGQGGTCISLHFRAIRIITHHTRQPQPMITPYALIPLTWAHVNGPELLENVCVCVLRILDVL